MKSVRHIQVFLSTLLIMCFFHEASSYAYCDDKSSTIENGHVRCTVNGHYTRYRTTAASCQLVCLPGYVAYPTAQFTCSSSGRRVLRIDSNGRRSHVSTGTWNQNVDSASCRDTTKSLKSHAPKMSGNVFSRFLKLSSVLDFRTFSVPTSCAAFSNPRHGSKTCTTKGDTQTCLRTCQYPYEVSEPLNQREHCGPETNFTWSHVIRRNSTEVPPCIPPQKCRDLQETDFPEHGQMRCKYEAWADTTICKLECERGYFPTDNNKTEVFCGPTTAFIWSHVHVQKNSYARIKGCKQSPITTEVTLTVDKPCREISTSEKEEDAQKLNLYLRSKVLHFDENSKFSYIGWNSYCEDKVIERVVSNNVISTTRDPVDPNSVLFNPEVNNLGIISLDVNLSYPLVSKDDQVSANSNLPTPLTEVTDETRAVENEKIVNVTVSELTYSLYYKALCTTGQCKEACRVLNVTQYQLCLDICFAKAYRSSGENQVKQLQILHVRKLMAEVDFPADVATAYSIINGAKFKSINVTTIPMETHKLTERQAEQMKLKRINYWGYRRSQDKC